MAKIVIGLNEPSREIWLGDSIRGDITNIRYTNTYEGRLIDIEIEVDQEVADFINRGNFRINVNSSN